MIRSICLKELLWLAPFTFLGLIAFTMMRPWPVFPAPAHDRIITDGQGVKVGIPLPVHVISGDGAVDYLELTHAPEALLKAGNPRQRLAFAEGTWGRLFYPQLAQNAALWNSPGDVESRLAQDDGATYFEWNAKASLRLGLAAVTLSPRAGENIFATLLRVENAALGDEARGEKLFADYQQAYADLKQELQPETLTNLPRVLPVGSSLHDWSNVWVHDVYDMFSDEHRVGVKNASKGYDDTGRQQEAERILAMNPDIIFGGVHDILQDPRWQGLKAVQNKRVYGGMGVDSGVPCWRFDLGPLLARWVAEVTHPERLQPKMRELTRDHFLKAYGYRLSDDEIDKMLGVAEQKNAPGYARFFKDYHVSTSATDSAGGATP